MKTKQVVLAGLLIVAMAGGALAIGLSAGKTAAHSCRVGGHSTTYTMTIKSGQVTPLKVVGALCDKLIITNKDGLAREIAFGPHENHVPYDGVAERVLNKGQSLTITLDQAGSFHWHDHLHDAVEGYFTVSQ